MEEYFDSALPGAVVVLLVDAKVTGTPLDVQAFDYLLAKGARPIVVATKIDKVPRSKRSRAEKELRERLALDEEHRVVPFSATTGEGARELWREIQVRL
jgi:GTP-binding protein